MAGPGHLSSAPGIDPLPVSLPRILVRYAFPPRCNLSSSYLTGLEPLEVCDKLVSKLQPQSVIGGVLVDGPPTRAHSHHSADNPMHTIRPIQTNAPAPPVTRVEF